ncbi:phosphatase domain-containing protein [Aureibaculum sp. 2210JD6-5]|uniref:App1 family protein n=1 Tax=Aureibaculum sp. 2210JD6-5 TaxID=3103957 RepID=UPI002AAD1993|nr:phosphatase domain-containing protein [Aureibaculum sp. 2210JD6-5]MDY7394976.1 phosphatase domain-containing protein [Aureibaculum sp. 2210JD6-5]
MIFKYISELIDDPDPVIVIPFGGFSNDKKIYAQARVLEDEGINEDVESSFSKNIIRSFKRFETDEKPNVSVKVTWQGKEKILVSDEEGYIYLNTEHGMDLNHQKTLWVPITYTLMESDETIFTITHPVMKPSPKAEYGVISDVDETILDTGLYSLLKWKVLVNTFIKHDEQRISIEGAQELCSQLYGGSKGYNENPFFYLSNSPWNLYDYLQAFLEKNNFPKGTLLLRDIGLENKKKKSFLEGNKYIKIKHILETYPSLSFILIGDAHDLDPEIYLEIAQQFPSRILCIYIRSVKKPKKLKRVVQLISQTTHVEILLAESTEQILEHAKSNGYIAS